MNSHYRAVLSQGWQIVKRHKSLWILGFFASFVLNTGISEGAFRNAVAIFQSGDFFTQISSLYAGRLSGILLNAFQIENIIEQANFFTAILAAGLILFLVYLATISYIGVIKTTANIEKSKKIDPKAILRDAHDHFGTVLALNIVSRLTLLFVFVLTSIPLYLSLATQNTETMIISTFVFFLLFIPISLATIFVFMYGTNFAILHKSKFIDSILNGWNLFTGNVLISVEIGFTMLLIRAAAVLLTFVIAGTIFVPLAAILGLLLYSNQIIFFSILVILGALLTILTYIIINSIFATYYLTTWTTLFINLTNNNMRGKLERVLDGIIGMIQSKLLNKPQQKQFKKVSDKLIREIKPQVQKLIKKAEENYPQAEKIIKEEFEYLRPTLKRAGKALKEDANELAIELKPIIKKSIDKATKSLEKSFPHTSKEIAKLTGKKKVTTRKKSVKK